MTDEAAKFQWAALCNAVADQMKVFTRPYANILAGGDVGQYGNVGTGTFIKRKKIEIITCEHVARFSPSAYFLDSQGSSQLEPGQWRVDSDEKKDVALASVAADEWSTISKSAQPLPISKFAQRHATVDKELVFFRGIAAENVGYIGSFGVDAIISGYCSQEKIGTGDSKIFEVLWNPAEVTVTTGTGATASRSVKYNVPEGFSGSLVWNTRFVELGCDFQKWSPAEAVVTGLLRRFDRDTSTLLVWRVEHLHAWL